MRTGLPAVIAALAALTFGAAGAAASQDTLYVYGPGGPLPAMQEAAQAFGARHGIVVNVVGGPMDRWIEDARSNADLIYSGSEHMMTDFIRSMEGRIDERTVRPLYLRPSAILVRPGNPREITRFEDLLRPDIDILVVNGAGQTGLWEDMVGSRGDIDLVRAFRANIREYAANSGEAKQMWEDQPELDAWLIWNIWQVANPQLADLVPVSEEWVVYRDCAVALTGRGSEQQMAPEFAEFLESPEGARIFAAWGWMTSPAARVAPARETPR